MDKKTTAFESGSRVRHQPLAGHRWSLQGAISAWVAAGMLIPVVAMAQPPSQTFNVTVTGPSQQQAQTLGSSAIATAIMQLRSLQRYSHYTRQAERMNDSDEPEVSAIGGPGFGAAVLAAAVASSDLAADFGRFNGFVSVDYRFGEQDKTARVPAYDFKRYGILVGADYRVNPDFVIGASLGYQRYKNDFTNISGHAEMNGWSLAGFGSWYPMDSWYVEGITRLGVNYYKTQRPLTPNGTASGETEGVGFSGSLGTGYLFNHNAWTVTPALRLTYSQTTVNAYVEQSSTGTGALRYQDQDVESLTSNLGGNATYAINTNFGVLLPQVNLEWVHQFKNDPSAIMAASSGANTFVIPVDARDEDYYRAAIGTTAVLPHGRILYVYYEAVLSLQNKDIHTLTLGGRIEF